MVLGDEHGPSTPTGYKVAPQSYAKLEAAATELRQYLPLVPGTNIIDGQKVLEVMLPSAGYSYKIAFANELKDYAAFTIPDEKLIVIREDVYEGLFEGRVFSLSTVVHELCHIVLRHHVTFHRGSELGKHRHFEDSEWQAKAMTAAVLMPLDLCRTIQDPRALADACGSSIQSATYRLNKLHQRGEI